MRAVTRAERPVLSGRNRRIAVLLVLSAGGIAFLAFAADGGPMTTFDYGPPEIYPAAVWLQIPLHTALAVGLAVAGASGLRAFAWLLTTSTLLLLSLWPTLMVTAAIGSLAGSNAGRYATDGPHGAAVGAMLVLYIASAILVWPLSREIASAIARRQPPQHRQRLAAVLVLVAGAVAYVVSVSGAEGPMVVFGRRDADSLVAEAWYQIPLHIGVAVLVGASGVTGWRLIPRVAGVTILVALAGLSALVAQSGIVRLGDNTDLADVAIAAVWLSLYAAAAFVAWWPAASGQEPLVARPDSA